MQKYLVLIQLLLLLGLSPMAHALDGTGTIEKVRVCTTGTAWKGVILFQLSDGNWFGHWGEYQSNAPHDYDGNTMTSTIMLAFSAKIPVKVRANHNNTTFCSIAATMIYNTAGDYIEMSSQ